VKHPFTISMFGWLVAACACARPTEPKETTMKRTYAWGTPACGDLAFGVSGPTQVRAGSRYTLGFAVANRSQQATKVTLFYNMEGTYRTRIYLSDAGHGSRFVGSVVDVPTTAPMRIELELAAGQVHERDAEPFELPADALGTATLQVVYGGSEAEPCEARSGTLALTIEAAR
jgi:hypothetical protein